jgi:hypothetical protein
LQHVRTLQSQGKCIKLSRRQGLRLHEDNEQQMLKCSLKVLVSREIPHGILKYLGSAAQK